MMPEFTWRACSRVLEKMHATVEVHGSYVAGRCHIKDTTEGTISYDNCTYIELVLIDAMSTVIVAPIGFLFMFLSKL